MPLRVLSKRRHPVLRALGLGLITGAADDDCSAIGTYAQAGAQLGYSILWAAPLAFPLMVTVVYLSGKLGQVSGQGLFEVMRRHTPRWIVYVLLGGVVMANTITAAADIGGMAAAIRMLAPIPKWLVVLTITTAVLALQIWGSYKLIQNVFRVLALTLLAYVASALLAHPDLHAVMRGTLVPHLHFDRDTLALVEAIVGTSLSVYIYSWQSNQEVEEKEAAGKHSLRRRRGTSHDELKSSLWDVVFGMFFSVMIMYFVLLATASTLFTAGHHEISSAVQAAESLKPVAGSAAGLLFTVGLIGVGFLAVPVMTSGAAYDVCQSFNWISGLHHKPKYARRFYGAIALFTTIAMALNFTAIPPMKALVWAGIAQGLATPPLMLTMLVLTNSKQVMGDKTNHAITNVFGVVTCLVILLASVCLIYSWLHR